MPLIRFIIAISSLIVLSFSASLKFVTPDDIKGLWYTTDREAIVEVYEKEGCYFGKIISVAKPLDKKGKPKKDHRNKDPKLREHPLIGLNTLYDLRYDAHEQCWKGKVYIPLTGMEVDATITLKEKKFMFIKGSMGALKKTQVWTRLK